MRSRILVGAIADPGWCDPGTWSVRSRNLVGAIPEPGRCDPGTWLVRSRNLVGAIPEPGRCDPGTWSVRSPDPGRCDRGSSSVRHGSSSVRSRILVGAIRANAGRCDPASYRSEPVSLRCDSGADCRCDASTLSGYQSPEIRGVPGRESERDRPAKRIVSTARFEGYPAAHSTTAARFRESGRTRCGRIRILRQRCGTPNQQRLQPASGA